MKYNEYIEIKGRRLFIMGKIFGYLWILLLLGVIPLIIGLPWAEKLGEKKSYSLAYSIGFFIQLALFQVAVTPIVFFYGIFIQIVQIYSFLLLGACVWSIWYIRKNYVFPATIDIPRLSVFEIIYLCGFSAIFFVQVIRGFTYDLTYMSTDDTIYTVISQQAIEGQGLGNILPATGESTRLDLRYGLPGWLYYPALLAYYSKISVATIAHTIQYVQLIVLAYAVYWYMSGVIFDNRQNRLIFILLIALFYWYGYHSHYSLTFRLLGPNYQGKAVVAVSLTPLVFSLLIQKLRGPFQWCFFWLLFLLSIAACSLTFWGAGTYIVIVALPVICSLFFSDRNFKYFFYIVSSSFIPVITAILFLAT